MADKALFLGVSVFSEEIDIWMVDWVHTIALTNVGGIIWPTEDPVEQKKWRKADFSLSFFWSWDIHLALLSGISSPGS